MTDDDTRELRRRLSQFAGIPAAAAARTPDPLPDMDTALDRLHAARRSAGMPELDDDEGLALGVRLAREPARSSLRSTRQTVRAVLDTNVVISTAVTPGVVALAQWNGALLVTGDSRLPVRAAPP